MPGSTKPGRTPHFGRWRNFIGFSVAVADVGAALAAGAFGIFIRWLRVPDAFSAPQFWAEDGKVLARRVSSRMESLLYSPCRLSERRAEDNSRFGILFDPVEARRLYAAAAILLTSWVAGTAALCVRPPLMGFLFGCALLIPPHASNITNIQWFSAPVLASLVASASKSPSRLISIDKATFAAAASLSGPFSVILVPMAALRLHWRRDVVSVLLLLGALIQAVAQPSMRAENVVMGQSHCGPTIRFRG